MLSTIFLHVPIYKIVKKKQVHKVHLPSNYLKLNYYTNKNYKQQFHFSSLALIRLRYIIFLKMVKKKITKLAPQTIMAYQFSVRSAHFASGEFPLWLSIILDALNLFFFSPKFFFLCVVVNRVVNHTYTHSFI